MPRTTPPSLRLADLLSRSFWFVPLDEEAKNQVRSDVSECTLAPGQSLSHAGEIPHAWFGVLEGLIKWSIVDVEGREITLGGQSVGSWFGEGTLIRGEPRESDLVALRHSRMALLPQNTFEWLQQTRPSFNNFLLRQVNERLHWFMGSFVARGRLDANGQVARALTGLMHPLLNPLGERHLHLSQDELAKLAAVSRQSCNTALAQFKDAGLLRVQYGALEVLDHARLAAWGSQ